MTIFSFYCFSSMYYILLTLDNYGFTSNNFTNKEFDRIIYLFYISKYIEFLDTYFLILMKKEVSYLQWIHHIGAPINLYYLYYNKDDGSFIFILLNGFIHILLYLYYAITIYGYKIDLKMDTHSITDNTI